MKICPSCKNKNAEGELFCVECGQTLSAEHATILATRKLQAVSGDVSAQAPLGTTRLGKDKSVALYIRDVADPIVLCPQGDMTIGRIDPDTGIAPGLDLTPFGGQDKGVSRLHAVLHWDAETLSLTDKGSANGTYLNGQRLEARRPYVLRDGDQIRFGMLVCHIYFK